MSLFVSPYTTTFPEIICFHPAFSSGVCDTVQALTYVGVYHAVYIVLRM